MRKIIESDYDDSRSLKKKEERIEELTGLIKKWVSDIAENDACIAKEAIPNFMPKILPFGSYFMGVAAKNGDIDIVVVTS